MKTENLVVCPCQHCNGNIEFDSNGLSKGNSKVQCPHCSVETVLFAPLSPPPPAQPAPKPRIAKLESKWKGSLEDRLGEVSFVLVALGVICMVVEFFMAISALERGSPWSNLGIGFAVLAACYLISLPLKVAAEIIRLLKKQSGIYVYGYPHFECSDCGRKMATETSNCPGCGAFLEKD